MTTWAIPMRVGPDYSGIVEIDSNHYEYLVITDKDDGNTLNNPMKLGLDIDSAEALHRSLGSAIATIKANTDPPT